MPDIPLQTEMNHILDEIEADKRAKLRRVHALEVLFSDVSIGIQEGIITDQAVIDAHEKAKGRLNNLGYKIG